MVGLKTDSNMWKVRLLVISFVTYLSSSEMRECYDPKTIPGTIGYFAPLKLLQIQTNFNGIFMNLKLTTEGQETMNTTCSHKDS